MNLKSDCQNYLIALILICFWSSGCKQESGHAHQHSGDQHKHSHSSQESQDHNHANKHMHKKSLEELAASFESPERMATQKPYEVIAMFGQIEGKTIMDIGAGTGYFSFKMVEKGAHVIAADVDDEFQNFIKNKMKELNVSDAALELRKVPYDSPGLAPGEVDGVLIVNTYHHIENRKPYFKKVYDGLKDDGMLMVVDFMKKEFDEDVPGPPVEMRISSEVVLDELSIAGFKKVYVNTTVLPYQYIVRAYKN